MKLIKNIAVIAAAAFAFAACDKANPVIYDPSQDTAQVLANINGCTLSEEGEDIATTFQAAAFSVAAPVTYTLQMDLSGNNFAEPQKLDAKIGDGTITISQSKLNKAIVNKGIAPDTEVGVDFRLAAYMTTDKGAAIEKYAQYSNIVSATFTTYEKILGDMPVVDVPGDYQGWAPSDYPKLFNYSFDEVHYRGVVDFQCKKEDGTAANGFKITGGGDWNNDTGNWGSADQSEAPEAAVVNLVNGDASQNIICYGANRYYLFEFNQDALTLTKIRSFDKVGVIGLNGDWDNDVVMTYNMYFGRFWADVDVPAATEFKFRLDGAWDANWGGNLEALSNGGDNIPIDAGQYRIYFYMNDETVYAEIDASMYGQEEPTVEPEPVPVPAYEGWGIIGVGGDWENDIAMTENGGVWTGYATLAADDSWKLRKDAGWDENYGGAFTALGTPFAAVANGDNIAVGQAGFFKITLNTNDATITIEEATVWSIIGDFNGWGGDVDMTLVDGKWVSPATHLTPGWKLRLNHDWGANRGGKFEALDTPFAVTDGGDNIDCGEGDFIVTYDPEAETITVSVAFPANIWSVIGGFAASGWNNDVKMTPLDGRFKLWVSDPFEMKAGDAFKVRFNREWAVNRGSSCGTLDYGQSAAAVADGADIKAPADGQYIVVYSETLEQIFFQAWSVIGAVGGSNWDKDFAMVPVIEEGVLQGWMSDAFSYTEGSGFKIRYNANWDVNRGGTMTNWADYFSVAANGADIKAPACSYIFAAYSPAEEEMFVGRADWSIIGDFNGWGGDEILFEIESGIYSGSVTLEAASGIKIRKDRDWAVSVGGVMTALDTPFAAESNNGPNINLEAGSYSVIYDTNNQTITIGIL